MKKRNTSNTRLTIRGIPLPVFKESKRKAAEKGITIGQYVAEALNDKIKKGE